MLVAFYASCILFISYNRVGMPHLNYRYFNFDIVQRMYFNSYVFRLVQCFIQSANSEEELHSLLHYITWLQGHIVFIAY